MEFKEVNKNFGFGCMRLPMIDDKLDYEEFNKMIDTFMAEGFNYFDTAHGYISGKSEIAIRECLAKELVEKVRDRMIFKMRYDELTLCTVFRGTLFVREDFGDND